MFNALSLYDVFYLWNAKGGNLEKYFNGTFKASINNDRINLLTNDSLNLNVGVGDTSYSLFIGTACSFRLHEFKERGVVAVRTFSCWFSLGFFSRSLTLSGVPLQSQL